MAHRERTPLGFAGALDRRDFLRRTARAAGGAALAASVAGAAAEAQDENGKTKVVVVTCPGAIGDDGTAIDVDAVRTMLDRGICALSGQTDAAQGWRTYIKPDDDVVLNEAGTWLANVPEVLLEVLAAIRAAGPKTARLAFYGHQKPEWRQGVTQGLQERGISEDVMSSELNQRIHTDPLTALVMCPTLKSHTVAGVSGVVKHFATICKEGPMAHHPNAMKTAGSVIVPEFGHLRKLFIVDALRFGETTRGPSYYRKSLLFGTDPVATDTIALDLFLQNCESHGTLPPRLHIETADSEYHAGTSDHDRIEVVDITL